MIIRVDNHFALALHDSLYCIEFFYRHDRFMRSLHNSVFDFAVIADHFLFQIIRRPLLMIGDDTAVKCIFQDS